MTPEEHAELERLVAQLPAEEAAIVRWHLQRRDQQICPDILPFIWLILAGRGAGKTKTGANHTYELIKKYPSVPSLRVIRFALVGEKLEDVKKTMIEEDPGLLSVIPEENILKWNRTSGELAWWCTDPAGRRREVHAQAYSSERPNQLRGPQFHLAWLDEPAKIADANLEPMKGNTTYSNLMFGLRLGDQPHLIVTGTPTPCALVKYLWKHPRAHITTGMSTYDNRENLAEDFVAELESLDQNSRIARQEIYGEILWDVPDALFSDENINANRMAPEQTNNTTLGWDPAVSSHEDSDEHGIILMESNVAHAFVTRDLSGHFTPAKAAQLIVATITSQKVDTLVLELNQGLEFVLTVLEQALKDVDPDAKFRKRPDVRTKYGKIRRFAASVNNHAFEVRGVNVTVGKYLRADPISTRYELGQVHHPTKPLATLESQMTSWSPTSPDSPDRLDALVIGLLHIFGDNYLNKRKATPVSAVPDVTIGKQKARRGDPYGVSLNASGARHSSLYSIDITRG